MRIDNGRYRHALNFDDHLVDVLDRSPEGPPDECWIWTGLLDRCDYGTIRWKINGHRQYFQAHILIWHLAYGDVPEGRVIGHTCRTHDCVNPKHLEAITDTEKNHRTQQTFQILRYRPNRDKYCIHGHDMTDANTYANPAGKYECRRCIADAQMRCKARRKAAA